MQSLGFNTTQINPFAFGGYNGMYGGNFVDLIFRHLMEHGWEGFTFMTILNFYLYLSLDRIKEVFKYINDVSAQHLKNNIEISKKYIFARIYKFIYYGIDKIKTISIPKFWKAQKIIDKKQKEINKSTVTLNCDNKVDLMAIGNFFMNNRKRTHLVDYTRAVSDVYKTTETYLVPGALKIDYAIIKDYNIGAEFPNLSPDIVINITQNVEMTLFCETDHKIEILKDVKVKTNGMNNIVELSYGELNKKIGEYLPEPASEAPAFKSVTINKDSDPFNLMNGNGTSGFIFYIYYTKNYDLFKHYYKCLQGIDYFDFNGKKYKIKSLGDSTLLIKDDAMMDKFIEEVAKYCEEEFYPYYEESRKELDDWADKRKYLFDTITVVLPYIKLSFESETMPNTQLSEYSRYFIHSLVDHYYKQNIDSIGNKISVYQLQIHYNQEIRKKENPEYAKWVKIHGEEKDEAAKDTSKNKNENEKKQDSNDSDDSDDSDSDDKNKDDDSNKPRKKKAEDKDSDNKSKSKHKKTASKNNYPHGMHNYPRYMSHDHFDYAFPFSGAYDIMPMVKPDKFIEEEIQIAVAESIHIKSDKKPFQYLYLQKSQKKMLESYLNNFRNNRELYDKMGIPYKGGILLSGVPGCGKTSTILAIGTYLNKDVYYLDLGKIKTNHELKICIDHVKTSSQRGGIIIFEDIDCMTDIVKCRIKYAQEKEKTKIRFASKKLNINQTAKDNDKPEAKNKDDDALSLSFLLNILDGTLSPENIIFVITTNHIEQLDAALIRPGRMDINIQIDKCDRYQLSQIFYDLYARHLSPDIIDKFPEHKYITAEVIMHLFHNIYNEDADDSSLMRKFLD